MTQDEIIKLIAATIATTPTRAKAAYEALKGAGAICETERETGFYWVKLTDDGTPFIAFWHGHLNKRWRSLGGELGHCQQVIVIGSRLERPE